MPSKNGFTLIELLIALVLSIVIVGAGYATFNSQQKSFSLTNQKADMQQEGRAAINFIMRDIRMAGCQVPNAKALVITDSTSGPDQISILHADATFFSGFTITSSGTTGSSSSVIVETQNGGSFAASNLEYVGKNIILVKKDETNSVIRKITAASGTGTQRTFTLTASPASTVFGDSSSDIGATYTGQYAYIVSTNTYSISSETLYLNKNTGGGNQALAENADDLQIAYLNKDGTTWYCYDSSHTTAPATITDIRAARINLLTRTTVPDPDFTGKSNSLSSALIK
jgi:type IV pilus assembly protein PilW